MKALFDTLHRTTKEKENPESQVQKKSRHFFKKAGNIDQNHWSHRDEVNDVINEENGQTMPKIRV